MDGELIFVLLMALGGLGLGALMVFAGGGFDDFIEHCRAKRRRKAIPSETRQKQLRDFWIEEQCRINPNMNHLYSGASFEKSPAWQLEQMIAVMGPMTEGERRAMTLRFMNNPSMRPETTTLQ